MAGYQRFVAYVYEYRKGKKDGSSGYVRVEARDQNCRIDVHLRCAGLEPGSRCRVYGFVRREGLMDGILIGSCVTGREQIECMLETNAEDIGGMGKSLQDLGGMLLVSDAGGFWGTEWDDQPIRPENFREWKKEKAESQKESGASSESEISENGEAKIMTAEEVQEEDERISVSPMNQEPEETPQEEGTISEEDELKVSESGRPQQRPGPRPPEPPRPGQPPSGPGPRPPEPPHSGRPGSGPRPPESPGPRPLEPPCPGRPSPGPTLRPPKPPRPTPGIPYDPFNDGQFTDCHKIKPSDCSALCRKNGCFCNNRFVMYGYQNFGHLLLCQNHRGQYILGVPGSYSQQERFMANMFGFPYFRESSEIQIPGGKGGYWYCFINL